MAIVFPLAALASLAREPILKAASLYSCGCCGYSFMTFLSQERRCSVCACSLVCTENVYISRPALSFPRHSVPSIGNSLGFLRTPRLCRLFVSPTLSGLFGELIWAFSFFSQTYTLSRSSAWKSLSLLRAWLSAVDAPASGFNSLSSRSPTWV